MSNRSTIENFTKVLNDNKYIGSDPKKYLMQLALKQAHTQEFPFPTIFEGFTTIKGNLPLEMLPHTLGDLHQELLDISFTYSDSSWVSLNTGERNATGSHYTPRSIRSELVRPALGALFRKYWEDEPSEYLDKLDKITILDPAMGAADLLLEAGLELSREKAWFTYYGAPRHSTIDWDEPCDVEEVFPSNPELDSLVVEFLVDSFTQSIFGVDIDSIAVELSKISIFTFCKNYNVPNISKLGSIQNNLKRGNALVGFTSETEVKDILKPYALDTSSLGINCWLEPKNPINYSDPVLYDLAFVLDYISKTKSKNKGLQEIASILGCASHEVPSTISKLLIGTHEESVLENIHNKLKSINPFHWELAFPQLFPKKGNQKEKVDAGVDCIVANPPFIGDRDLRGRIGQPMVEYLSDRYTGGSKPDYCGFFFLRFAHLANGRGVVGTLAPNSIAQASNRDYITKRLLFDDQSFRAYRGMPNRPWPGEAAVHYCMVHMARPKTVSKKPRLVVPVKGDLNTDEWTVREIEAFSSYLDEYPEFDLHKLPSMPTTGIAFTGMFLRGNFSVHREPGHSLQEAIAAVPERERDALAAYLNNRDVQQNAIPTPSDVVIDFFEPLRKAELANANAEKQQEWLEENYPVLFNQLQTRSPHDFGQECIFEQRAGLKSSSSNDEHKKYWWLFGSPRHGLREAWRDFRYVLIFGRVIKVWSPPMVRKEDPDLKLVICPTEAVSISAHNDPVWIGTVLSFLTETLVRRQCSTLKSDLRFTPSDVFPYFPTPWKPWFKEGTCELTTFPIPESAVWKTIGEVGEKLIDHRTALLKNPAEYGIKIKAQWGPTKLYNLYDDEEVETEGVEKLRQLHVDLFQAVLRAYGWDDLAETSKREDWGFERPWLDRTMRFVPSEEVRAEVYRRMGELNAERYRYELGLFLERAMSVMGAGHELSRNQVAEAMEAKYCPNAAGGGKSLDHGVLEAALEMGVEEGLLVLTGNKYKIRI